MFRYIRPAQLVQGAVQFGAVRPGSQAIIQNEDGIGGVGENTAQLAQAKISFRALWLQRQRLPPGTRCILHTPLGARLTGLFAQAVHLILPVAPIAADGNAGNQHYRRAQSGKPPAAALSRCRSLRFPFDRGGVGRHMCSTLLGGSFLCF